MASAYHPLTSFESLTQPHELERLGRDSRFRWKRPVTRSADSNKFKNFPSIGFFALLGSLITVFLSLGILLGINGQAVWPENGIFNVLQPASLLSLHMSMNAVLIEIALAEGLNISWWYQATKSNTTLRDLHDIWAIGHSYRKAVQIWRGLDWLTLAAIFVALSPINGVLLQAAITTPVSPVATNHTLTIPMVKQLDLGYSAYPAPTADLWGAYTWAQWFSIWKQVTLAQWTSYANYAYFGSVSDKNQSAFNFGYNNLAPYQARALGAGFEMTCDASTERYDLNQGKLDVVTGRIFSSSISWDYLVPNEINLYFLWKPSGACAGEYQIRNCNLRAATVEYPIVISMNISGSIYKGPFFGLAPGSTRADDRVVRILPVYPDEGKDNTTFGGIAGSLLDFESYYDITTYLNGSYTIDNSGPLVRAIAPTFGGSTEQCGLSFQFSLNQLASYLALGKGSVDKFVQEGDYVQDANIDPSELVFQRLRQGMFLSSVYQGTKTISNCCALNDGIDHGDDYYFQDVNAIQTLQVAKYHVRWWLWGISVGLTWLTAFLVIPLFRGYWLLNRKTSMSPVEIARLFHAPGISQFDEQMDHKAVLKKAGSMKVYEDIRSSGASVRDRHQSDAQSMTSDYAPLRQPEPTTSNEYGSYNPVSTYNPVSPFSDMGTWLSSRPGYVTTPTS